MGVLPWVPAEPPHAAPSCTARPTEGHGLGSMSSTAGTSPPRISSGDAAWLLGGGKGASGAVPCPCHPVLSCACGWLAPGGWLLLRVPLVQHLAGLCQQPEDGAPWAWPLQPRDPLGGEGMGNNRGALHQVCQPQRGHHLPSSELEVPGPSSSTSILASSLTPGCFSPAPWAGHGADAAAHAPGGAGTPIGGQGAAVPAGFGTVPLTHAAVTAFWFSKADNRGFHPKKTREKRVLMIWLLLAVASPRGWWVAQGRGSRGKRWLLWDTRGQRVTTACRRRGCFGARCGLEVRSHRAAPHPREEFARSQPGAAERGSRLRHTAARRN